MAVYLARVCIAARSKVFLALTMLDAYLKFILSCYPVFIVYRPPQSAVGISLFDRVTATHCMCWSILL